ncbi:hypothetical protein TSMEX_008736 [Taenia solium]
MLGVAVFLIAVACSSEAEPTLWGSRIVGTTGMSSPLMYFSLPKEAVIKTLWTKGENSAIDVKNGACYIGDQVVGEPCQMDAESANLTVNDVSKEAGLQIWGEEGLFSTAIFVPNCKFQKPEEGEWRELEKSEQK